MQCHYNLRTRSTDERCPECGLPIAETLAHLRQSAGLIADERALNAGARLLGWTSLAAAPSLACAAAISAARLLLVVAVRCACGKVVLSQWRH